MVLYGDLQCVAFAKNTSFKSYGIICLPLLPSTLSDELSVDRRNSSEFFLDEGCVRSSIAPVNN